MMLLDGRLQSCQAALSDAEAVMRQAGSGGPARHQRPRQAVKLQDLLQELFHAEANR